MTAKRLAMAWVIALPILAWIGAWADGRETAFVLAWMMTGTYIILATAAAFAVIFDG